MKTLKLSLLNINLRWFLLAMILANIASQMVMLRICSLESYSQFTFPILVN